MNFQFDYIPDKPVHSTMAFWSKARYYIPLVPRISSNYTMTRTDKLLLMGIPNYNNTDNTTVRTATKAHEELCEKLEGKPVMSDEEDPHFINGVAVRAIFWHSSFNFGFWGDLLTHPDVSHVVPDVVQILAMTPTTPLYSSIWCIIVFANNRSNNRRTKLLDSRNKLLESFSSTAP